MVSTYTLSFSHSNVLIDEGKFPSIGSNMHTEQTAEYLSSILKTADRLSKSAEFGGSEWFLFCFFMMNNWSFLKRNCSPHTHTKKFEVIIFINLFCIHSWLQDWIQCFTWDKKKTCMWQYIWYKLGFMLFIIIHNCTYAWKIICPHIFDC